MGTVLCCCTEVPVVRKRVLLVALVMLVLVGCASPPGPGGTASDPAASHASRTLVMGVRYEVVGLAPKRLEAGASEWTKRPFNASLAVADDAGTARPYLADSLPQLNTTSWIVGPNGTMETTYRLRPDLRWHDGQPLTADDFVFAREIYSARGLDAFTTTPQDHIDDVIAADPRTIVIRWNAPFGEAGALVSGMFDPLPRHILQAPFASYQQDPAGAEAFLAHPFWTTEYVGLGPYRLAEWRQSIEFEGAAFDGHVLGRPRIDRVVIRVFADENAAAASLVAGSVDIVGNRAIRPEHAVEIKRQLEDGIVSLVVPAGRHYLGFQFRPEYLRTPALLDLRVRRALAHAVDRDAINEAMFDGGGPMGDQWVPPGLPYYAEVNRSVTHYVYDPRRAGELMAEAGLIKDAGGFFANANGERFRPQLMVDASGLFEREMTTILDTWARAGIDAEPRLLPAAEFRLLSARTTFPGIYGISSGLRESQLDVFSTAQIASQRRGWAGNNRVGWSDPEYDLAWNSFNSLLDRGQRDAQVVQMMRVATDQLPAIMVHFNPSATAFRATLHGPETGSPEAVANWNMFEWTLD
jgi:peptide/nickel transport system substrate-binding protein